MEQLQDVFNVTLTSGPLKDKLVTIKPEETTDGIPLYHCHVQGTCETQLRQDATGVWVQVWGKLPAESVAQLGRLITAHQQ